MGMFVNTLEMEPKRKKRFDTFLDEVRDDALKAYENQDYQFLERLTVERLNLKRDLSRNTVFDIMFTCRKHGISET